MVDNEAKKQLEALLFSSGRPMEIDELAKLLGVGSPEIIKKLLKLLKKEYEARDSPLMVFEEKSSWKLAVRETYLGLVRKINPYTEFPKTVMETLAVIAWKQPILQSTVIKIRTNKAYEHIKELKGMGFVVKEKYGRTSMLKLTQKFYDYFDLQDKEKVKDLFARFKDEARMEQKQVDDFDDTDKKIVNNKNNKEPEAELSINEDGEISEESESEPDSNEELPELESATADSSKHLEEESMGEVDLIDEIEKAEESDDPEAVEEALVDLGTVHEKSKSTSDDENNNKQKEE